MSAMTLVHSMFPDIHYQFTNAETQPVLTRTPSYCRSQSMARMYGPQKHKVSPGDVLTDPHMSPRVHARTHRHAPAATRGVRARRGLPVSTGGWTHFGACSAGGRPSCGWLSAGGGRCPLSEAEMVVAGLYRHLSGRRWQ